MTSSENVKRICDIMIIMASSKISLKEKYALLETIQQYIDNADNWSELKDQKAATDADDWISLNGMLQDFLRQCNQRIAASSAMRTMNGSNERPLDRDSLVRALVAAGGSGASDETDAAQPRG